eukprot:355593-Chlamydomonas_euryale.AAC.1
MLHVRGFLPAGRLTTDSRHQQLGWKTVWLPNPQVAAECQPTAQPACGASHASACGTSRTYADQNRPGPSLPHSAAFHTGGVQRMRHGTWGM